MLKSAPLSLLILTSASLAAPSWAEPDLTGLWYVDQAATPRQAPPLTPAAQAEAAAQARRTAAGRLMSEAHTKCWPTGMPQMMIQPFGLEILQTKGRITVLNEVSTLPRTIHMQLDAHPKDVEPSWNGHSIGKWEGETLVVDTVGLNGRHARTSTRAHIVERISVIEGGKVMLDEITQEDPAVYTRPLVTTYRYNRLPEDASLMEYVCEVDPAELAAFEAEQPSTIVRHPGGAAGHSAAEK